MNKVAQRAGLARQTVSFIEQEIQSPRLDTMLRISGVLGVKLEKLVAEARRRAGR